jgi:superfamily II DNA/RNA helicase
MGDDSSKKEKKQKKDKKEKKEKKRERGDSDGDGRAAKKSAAAAVDGADAMGKQYGDDGNKSKSKTASTTTYTGVSWDTFDSTDFPDSIKHSLTSAGFSYPSEIQKKAWPSACEGKDVIAVAKTGSGKTLAFLLPMLHRLLLRKQGKGTLMSNNSGSGIPSPDGLVLAPTRELAIQIHAEAVKFGKSEGLSSVCLYGGAPAYEQKNALKAHLNDSNNSLGLIVIATPGRLCDLMQQKAVSLQSCFMITLDEADRMLDMGFEPQLKEVFAEVPAVTSETQQIGQGRQTTLFTATWPKAVRKLASTFLAEGKSVGEDGESTQKKHSAVRVFLGGGDGADAGELSANKSVTQRFIKAQDDEKDKHMYELLTNLKEGSRVVAFANTKRRVEMLSKTFWNFGFGTCAVHGDKQQKEREAALKKFTDNECPLMFATDVAARGLDIKGVTHVVNFDMARDVESYVHRIGRTGRAGELGESITFWNPDYDIACSPALCKIARDAGQEVPEWLQKYEKGKESKQWKVADAVLK